MENTNWQFISPEADFNKTGFANLCSKVNNNLRVYITKSKWFIYFGAYQLVEQIRQNDITLDGILGCVERYRLDWIFPKWKLAVAYGQEYMGLVPDNYTYQPHDPLHRQTPIQFNFFSGYQELRIGHVKVLELRYTEDYFPRKGFWELNIGDIVKGKLHRKLIK